MPHFTTNKVRWGELIRRASVCLRVRSLLRCCHVVQISTGVIAVWKHAIYSFIYVKHLDVGRGTADNVVPSSAVTVPHVLGRARRRRERGRIIFV